MGSCLKAEENHENLWRDSWLWDLSDTQVTANKHPLNTREIPDVLMELYRSVSLPQALVFCRRREWIFGHS